jgi:hypothetical protein
LDGIDRPDTHFGTVDFDAALGCSNEQDAVIVNALAHTLKPIAGANDLAQNGIALRKPLLQWRKALRFKFKQHANQWRGNSL